MTQFCIADLEGYLDEALPPEQMAAIEAALRQRPDLAEQLTVINGRRDAGVHSLGEIWRRHRSSCPTREELGSYLLDVLPQEAHDYITFHLEKIGCRYCQASLVDLQNQEAEAAQVAQSRRRKYFQSSAGYLGTK